MEKEEIQIRQAIVHILDSAVGMPVLSNTVLDFGSDFADFLKSHIYKVLASDDIRPCSFQKEESEVYGYLLKYMEEKQADEEKKESAFIEASQKIAELLFTIMNKNIDIPQADLIVSVFEVQGELFLALLKMNYRTSYTHLTDSDPWGNKNDIILQKAILPSESQRLKEAAIISLHDFSVRLMESKYDINGTKMNYFSSLFLRCKGALSQKTKLAIVTKAVEDIQKKYYDESEQFEVHMETKSIIGRQLEEGVLNISETADEVFREKEQMKQEFKEKLEKYNLTESEVVPQNKSTTRKFEMQHLKTDTGIEIKIPMEQYDNKDSVEFVTNTDGTISVLIKNIGSIMSR